jgi:hypothetical protein
MGVFSTFGPVVVTASGLAAGDYIFAAETLNKMVWRCELGPANPFGSFLSMNAPAQNFGETTWGIVYTNGVLYTMSDNGTAATGATYLNNTLVPTVAGTHTAAMWGTEYASAAGVIMGNLPRALKTSAGAPGSIMLYTWNFGTNGIFYLDDNVAMGAPVLLGPADDYLVQIVSALTGAVQPVNFTWSRLSKATGYQLQIALDANFDEQIAGSPFGVGLVAGVGTANTADPVSSIQGAGGLLAPLFQPGNTYYWRVRSTDPLTSSWSETRTFTVQPTAASVPSISSPAVGTTIDSVSPAFSWAPVSGATTYRFELSESAYFTSLVYTVDTVGAGAQLPAGTTLVPGTTYFWRVKALTPVESDWSTVANFVVAAEQPAPTPQVTVTNPPDITITVPPAPPATEIILPTQPADKVINPTYIWAIIIIGAILVIAVIVLIVRTRRSV